MFEYYVRYADGCSQIFLGGQMEFTKDSILIHSNRPQNSYICITHLNEIQTFMRRKYV